jgi:hypothetical protein
LHFFNFALFLLCINGCKDQNSSNFEVKSQSIIPTYSTSIGNVSDLGDSGPAIRQDFQSYRKKITSNNLENLDDGDFDCAVTNITRGNGPYNLDCEKYGDEITIHFRNGGFIITDLDGFHAENGEYWEIEEN